MLRWGFGVLGVCVGFRVWVTVHCCNNVAISDLQTNFATLGPLFSKLQPPVDLRMTRIHNLTHNVEILASQPRTKSTSPGVARSILSRSLPQSIQGPRVEGT